MPYPVLSPSGAVARDHLSNERTMLAYLRTSMSFLSLGVGVVRLAEYAIINPLKPLNLEKYPEMLRHDYYIATTYAKPLGALSLAAALLTLAFGMARYCTMFNRIVRSERFQNVRVLSTRKQGPGRPRPSGLRAHFPCLAPNVAYLRKFGGVCHTVAGNGSGQEPGLLYYKTRKGSGAVFHSYGHGFGAYWVRALFYRPIDASQWKVPCRIY
ncbi:hypothetical protein KL946_001554 [Ogataea haglerorum]|uniref:DUF202 domain-containing protein n=1 Tax=Ogataea haglerorum TaxID=1937702 RepID=A0ABQ7RKJ4_9ASCO|nr:hypothetical protein KL946_001554 [Ogataea haglerorum]